MSFLSPRLQLKVSQKQILTPGLVQMVTVLQLNRLELKEMITQEIVKNPVLEEATEEAGEEITPEELLPLLEAEATSDPADRQILEATPGNQTSNVDGEQANVAINGNLFPDPEEASAVTATEIEAVTAGDPPTEPAAADPFDEIDFGSFFDEYLDPGYKSPAAESVEKPSFETFLSAPVTLGDHLRSQLAVVVLPDAVRDAAEAIIGNLDEDGYLLASIEEIAPLGDHQAENVEAALAAVQSLDPAGVGARDLRECLLLQIASVNGTTIHLAAAYDDRTTIVVLNQNDASTGLSPAQTRWAYHFNSTALGNINGVLVIGLPGASPAVSGRFAISGPGGTGNNSSNNLTALGGVGLDGFLHFADLVERFADDGVV